MMQYLLAFPQFHHNVFQLRVLLQGTGNNSTVFRLARRIKSYGMHVYARLEGNTAVQL